MATFTVQVTDYLSDAVTTGDLGITEAMIDLWMQEGAKYVIVKMPKKLWHHFSSISAEKTTDGYASERPLRVVRESGTDDDFIDCREIDPSSAKDFASISATSDPAYYHENGKVYVLPAPGADPNAFKVIEVTLPTIDGSADSTIANFPSDLYQAVVKYAVMQCKLREFAFMRRKTQIEIAAATTLLTATATANAAAKTEFDKLAVIIDEANAEFDKIDALLTLGETDSEAAVTTALAAITTAAGRINTAVGLANAEFDLVNPDVDSADTILDTDEDVNRTSSALNISTTRIANGRAYLEEAIAATNEASTYANEVASRLGQATAKIQAGSARGNFGSAYLAEANSRIANGTAYLSELSGYLGQAQIRVSNSGAWLNMGQQSVADKQLLQQDVNSDIASFIQ